MWSAEAYSEPCQTSKMALLAKIVGVFQPLTVFVKSFILDVWQGSEYASADHIKSRIIVYFIVRAYLELCQTSMIELVSENS